MPRSLRKQGRKQFYPGLGVCRRREWEARSEPQGPTGFCSPSGQPGAPPLAPCPLLTHTLAPACLTQSPPAAKPGPHLGVILCLTSSRHLGLFGLISGSLALTPALPS